MNFSVTIQYRGKAGKYIIQKSYNQKHLFHSSLKEASWNNHLNIKIITIKYQLTMAGLVSTLLKTLETQKQNDKYVYNQWQQRKCSGKVFPTNDFQGERNTHIITSKNQ